MVEDPSLFVVAVAPTVCILEQISSCSEDCATSSCIEVMTSNDEQTLSKIWYG